MLWVLKRTVSLNGPFEHLQHMFIFMGKKIMPLLRSTYLLNWSYEQFIIIGFDAEVHVCDR